jgi:hypothetical protein
MLGDEEEELAVAWAEEERERRVGGTMCET